VLLPAAQVDGEWREVVGPEAGAVVEEGEAPVFACGRGAQTVAEAQQREDFGEDHGGQSRVVAVSGFVVAWLLP